MLYLDNPQEKSRVAYPQMGGGYTKKRNNIPKNWNPQKNMYFTIIRATYGLIPGPLRFGCLEWGGV